MTDTSPIIAGPAKRASSAMAGWSRASPRTARFSRWNWRVGEARVDGKKIFTGFVRDLTSREKIEGELRQSQKMEAVGQLTGGVAHDFNNLLTVITANLEMLAPHLGDPDQRELAKEAHDAAQDGAKLAAQLLAFGRRQPLNPKPTDLGPLVSNFAELLRRTLGESIELRDPGRGIGASDRGQLFATAECVAQPCDQRPGRDA